jgi:hypothetical protein
MVCGECFTELVCPSCHPERWYKDIELRRLIERLVAAQEGLYALAKAEAARKAEIAKAFTLGGTGGLLDGFKRKSDAYCESADGKSYSHKAINRKVKKA